MCKKTFWFEVLFYPFPLPDIQKTFHFLFHYCLWHLTLTLSTTRIFSQRSFPQKQQQFRIYYISISINFWSRESEKKIKHLRSQYHSQRESHQQQRQHMQWWQKRWLSLDTALLSPWPHQPAQNALLPSSKLKQISTRINREAQTLFLVFQREFNKRKINLL